MISTGVKYEPTNGTASGTSTSYKQFTYHDSTVTSGYPWKSLATNGSVTLRSSYYYYYPTTLTDIDDKTATVGIGVNTTEYKMLFTNSSTGADTSNSGNETNFCYWFGSPFVITITGYANFGVRNVYSGYVAATYLYYSYGKEYTPYYGVRPVVTLDSKVRLKDSGTWKDGCKLYNLVIK